MSAKCLEADSDFREEVDALVRNLSPSECQRALEIVCADRETPEELKETIEGNHAAGGDGVLRNVGKGGRWPLAPL